MSLKMEIAKKVYQYHWMWQTRFYRTWYNILWRCYRNTRSSSSYKDKGVVVEWKSFIEFKNDMYDGYLQHSKIYGEQNTTIDRINNDWNYSKENCRRATYKRQMCNNSRTHMLTKDWVTKSTKERSEDLAINENTMRVRILRWHDPFCIWKIPDKRGTTIPHYKKHKELFGDKARTYHCIYRRIHVDWRDIDKAINTL